MRTALALLAAVSLAVSLAGCASRPAVPGSRPVVVIGIDGMDPQLLQRFVDRGSMPHFAALMQRGSFAPLETSIPPQSPVAWSNFITGMDPGGHGVFDFIHRDPQTYLPRFSTASISAPGRTLRIGPWRIPLAAGKAELLRKGEAFWQILGRHGVPCAIYRIPSNFPPVPGKGVALSGMGTPDLLGGYGTFSFYTDDTQFDAGPVPGGEIHRVEVREGHVDATLTGPENTLRADKRVMTRPFRIDLDPAGEGARVTVEGRSFLLAPGEWSDWIEVHFDALGRLKRVPGICRFHLQSVRPLRLYVTPINLDPTHPALPISVPPGFARALRDRIGDFYTQGMPEDTKALESGVFDDAEFIAQSDLVLAERWRMLDFALRRYAGGFLFFYVSTIDQSSHMLWREMAHTDSTGDDDPAGHRLEHLYAEMDSLLGVVEERIPREATLIVMSDHGFAPYKKEFHLNTWLHQHGYLELQPPGLLGVPLLRNVAWRRTRAYALGINGLYLNVMHREGKGIVRPGTEYDRLLDRITAELLAVRDPETGVPVITRVDRPARVYHGPEVANAPDLIIGYNRGYRGSDESALGTVGEAWLTPNQTRWSGDHCIDHTLVPGVLLVNRPGVVSHASLLDLPVTILALYGIPKPASMRGRVLFTP